MAEYKVKIADNFHYGQQDYVEEDKAFDNSFQAIERCKEICIGSLWELYEKDISADQLMVSWSLHGEDPYIVDTQSHEILFSAREFIDKELCEQVINIKKGEQVAHATPSN